MGADRPASTRSITIRAVSSPRLALILPRSTAKARSWPSSSFNTVAKRRIRRGFTASLTISATSALVSGVYRKGILAQVDSSTYKWLGTGNSPSPIWRRSVLVEPKCGMAWAIDTAWSKSVPPRRMPWLARMRTRPPSLRKTEKSDVPPPIS